MRITLQSLAAAVIAAGWLIVPRSAVAGGNGLAMIYQGQFKVSGRPFTGEVDVSFTLWDALNDGQQVGDSIEVGNVSVVNGLFTTQLDFDPDSFDGSTRWLQVAICPDCTLPVDQFTVLSPRQPIGATPQALFAQNADTLDGFRSTDFLTNVPAPLDVSADVAGSFALQGVNSGNDLAIGVSGIAMNADGINSGVYGATFSILGTGVHGEAYANSGITTGVRGTAASPSGQGVFGFATAASGFATGVYGASNSPSGFGVYGIGVASVGSSIGVKGQTHSADGYAGYFQGRTALLGFVGVLNQDPAYPLDVTGRMRIRGDQGNGGGTWLTNSSSPGADASYVGRGGDGQNWTGIFSGDWRLVVQDTGRVGIGTPDPFDLLDVSGTLRIRSSDANHMLLHGALDDGYIDLVKSSDPTPSARIEFNGYSDQAVHRGLILFHTRGEFDGGLVERMRISDNGNVGIGTNFPDQKLEVAGEQAIVRMTSSNNIGGSVLELRSDAATRTYLGAVNFLSAGATVGQIGYHGTDDALSFTTNSAERLRIDSTGRLGIGTANPASALHLARTGTPPAGLSGNDNGLLLGTEAPSGYKWIQSYGGTLAMNPVGNSVAVATTDAMGFTFAVNGTAAKPGGGSWTTYSDARLKRDVTPMSGTLERLLSLRGYEFEYTDRAVARKMGLPGPQIGLLAQEVARVFPDWVGRDQEGFLHVTERGTTALLIEALREVRAEKDAELAERDAQIEQLSDRLARLEARLTQVCKALAKNEP